MRFTTPLMISPTRSLNSSYCRLRSYSRTRCTITCLAVCAAMRPKSIGGSGSTRYSPSLISGLNLRAMWTGIWVSSFSTVSTASVQRDRRTSPVLRSMVARMSFSCPYLARPAFWMACSMASSTSSRSMFFSRATASATSSSSGRAMAVSMMASRSVGPGRGCGGVDQRVGQHQLGAADVGERQGDFVAVVEAEAGGVRRRRRARCRRSACGRRSARPISARARWPAKRFQSFTRVSGRSMPAELISSVQAPGIGSSTSITAPSAWLMRLAVVDRDRRRRRRGRP